MKLNHSKVKFYEVEHQYWLDNIQLFGITDLLRRQLFPDTYKGIDEKVMKSAAERGSKIHNDIELHDSLNVKIDTIEVKAYDKLKEKHKLTTLENEYLVSDLVNYASCIDIVFEDLSLCDIKTTSTLHKDYVAWQLSIYAYLFELQNRELKANRLYALWIPKPSYGAPKLVELNRIPADECKRLLECDMLGIQYQPKQDVSVETSIAELIRSISTISNNQSAQEFECKLKSIEQAVLMARDLLTVKIKELSTPKFSNKIEL